MTQNGNFKRRVRARAAKTGESFTSALRHVRQKPDDQTAVRSLRLAVAQTSYLDDPGDVAGLAANGQEVQRLMRVANAQGARVIHFPEGTLCFPNKRLMSEVGPKQVGNSDWSRYDWAAVQQELTEIAKLARELKLWTIVGAVHKLSSPHRPHNSLYIISDQGQLVDRYDERMLSNTKLSFMYSPGRAPVTFDVDGVRFGCALGMEIHFSEIFEEYRRLEVDCVLFSTTGDSPSLAPPLEAETLGHAASNWYWVSYAAHAPQSETVPAGIASANGQWAARCTSGGHPDVVVANIEVDPEHPARLWRRLARSDIYATRLVVDDPRSESRKAF
jgi:predicted amidohydrolase